MVPEVSLHSKSMSVFSFPQHCLQKGCACLPVRDAWASLCPHTTNSRCCQYFCPSGRDEINRICCFYLPVLTLSETEQLVALGKSLSPVRCCSCSCRSLCLSFPYGLTAAFINSSCWHIIWCLWCRCCLSVSSLASNIPWSVFLSFLFQARLAVGANWPVNEPSACHP